MIEIEINKQNFDIFYKNLRFEDYLEIKYFFPKNTKKKFYKELLKLSRFYFLADDNYFPVAIGGVEKDLINPKIGVVWLLCTKNYVKHKIELFKYISNKLNAFKLNFDILYNRIYKTNFTAQKWLKKMNFQFVKTSNPDFMLFYFINGDKKIDLRYIAGE